MEHRYGEYFKGKRITVMGLGLLGRGVGDARFLAECGADVLVTDLKTADVLKASVAQLDHFPNVTFVLGEHRKEDFEHADLILVAAGVPQDSLFLEHARRHNVPLAMSAALFAKLAGVPVIGITGTRGKSTVTAMIHHVLLESQQSHVLLGGNVRGVSNLQLLREVREDTVAVMELDSWQLQGFGWDTLSPHIAVFTNFMPDHLNYYHGDMDAYFADKANIFLHQSADDILVTIPEVRNRAETFLTQRARTFDQRVVTAMVSVLPDDMSLLVPGAHNRLNASLAFEALRAQGVPEEVILTGLSTFPGVEGRLQYVREINGVKIYNDNNATTPHATRVGLEAVGTTSERNVVLIMGGADKNIDMDELLETIPRYVKKVVLLPGTGTDRIAGAVAEPILVDTVEEAVTEALRESAAGDTVLFSPAFASFGMFVNEYERNDQFMSIVEKL